eukprot:COSAG01_NODE_180_length_22910_cov_19.255710_12_plen_203_part_00
MRRCRGCKNPRCDDPVVSHWGCKRARPAQHSANALQRLVSSVPPARGDAQPGGFVHRVGCGGCSDDEDCDRTRATPLCPYGADRTWEIDAARVALLPAETMPPASAAARAPARQATTTPSRCQLPSSSSLNHWGFPSGTTRSITILNTTSPKRSKYTTRCTAVFLPELISRPKRGRRRAIWRNRCNPPVKNVYPNILHPLSF